MVRERDDDEYEVKELVGVRPDPNTGKAQFRVRWKGYTASHDTWEPVEHLENVLGMCNEYLLIHGYSPLTETKKLQRIEDDAAGEEEMREPKPRKKPKKEEGYQPIMKETKPAKVVPKYAKDVKVPSGRLIKAENRVPGRPAALPKPPSLTSQLRPISDHSVQPVSLVKKSNPAFRPPQPTASVQFTSELPSTRPVKISSPTPPTVQPPPLVNSLDQSTAVVSGSNPLQGLRVRRADWEFDRPLQILGCRVGEAGLEYSVLFAFDTGVVPLPRIVSHEELITKAPWLFARFFIMNHKVFIP